LVFSTSLAVYGGDTDLPVLPPGWFEVYSDITTYGSNVVYGVRVTGDDQQVVTIQKASGQAASVWLMKAWVVRGAVTTGDPFDDVQTDLSADTDVIDVPMLDVTGDDRLIFHLVLPY